MKGPELYGPSDWQCDDQNSGNGCRSDQKCNFLAVEGGGYL